MAAVRAAAGRTSSPRKAPSDQAWPGPRRPRPQVKDCEGRWRDRTAEPPALRETSCCGTGPIGPGRGRRFRTVPLPLASTYARPETLIPLGSRNFAGIMACVDRPGPGLDRSGRGRLGRCLPSFWIGRNVCNGGLARVQGWYPVDSKRYRSGYPRCGASTRHSCGRLPCRRDRGACDRPCERYAVAQAVEAGPPPRVRFCRPWRG
jgi:hypothetical protein